MSKIAMARAYAHKGMTKMERHEQEHYEEVAISEVVEHPTLGRCYIGNFIQGLGAFNVHFPADALRPVTEAERAELMRQVYVGPGIKHRLQESEFATQADLDAMPVVALKN